MMDSGVDRRRPLSLSCRPVKGPRFIVDNRSGGQPHWPHVVANDPDCNMYFGEVDGAARVQKFLRYGATGCSGTGSAEVGKYVP